MSACKCEGYCLARVNDGSAARRCSPHPKRESERPVADRLQLAITIAATDAMFMIMNTAGIKMPCNLRVLKLATRYGCVMFDPWNVNIIDLH